MPERKGSYIIQLSNRPMILSYAAVVGKKEGEGPLGNVFDRAFEDTTLNEKTWGKSGERHAKGSGDLRTQQGGAVAVAGAAHFCG